MSAFEGADEKTILVSFKTKEAEYAVTEKPFAVPERLTRLGLSQVINHLLDREKNPIPFDFIIENEFLRTSLEVWLRRNNKTEEETITIWYMRALGELEQNSQLLHPDWVGALDKFTSSLTDHAQLPLFSGCYDGAVRLWLTAHNTTVMPDNASLELKGHTQPIKAVASFTDPNATDAASLSLGVVSGSLDRSIIMWRVQITKRALSGKHDKSAPQEGCSGVQAMRLVGHEGGVEDLDVDPTSLLMCTGSWDHTVKIWDLREEATDYNADNEEAPEDGPKKKKQKKNKNASTQIERKSIRTYTGHKGVVNAIYFSEQGSRMVTGSWDGGIRLWDVESALTLSQAKTSSPVLGMTRPAPVVASGHSDYAIRLWDSRAPDTVRSLTAHRAMPASLCWLSGSLLVNEQNDGSDSALPMLASADYNGTIKVWDMRASVPLVSLSRAHNKGLPNNNTTTNNTAVKTPPHKVLSMTAFKVKDSPQYIVTGGTDNRALIHRL